MAVTWDSANKSSFITLSGGDLIATGNAGVGASMPVIATAGKTTGKWYFEVSVAVVTSGDSGVVGIANALPADFTIPGSATNTHISYHTNSFVYRNSGNDGGATGQAAWGVPSGTYIIGVAFDADADKVWFALGNTFAGDPAAGTGGNSPTGITTYYPMFAPDRDQAGTLKATAASQTYSPPSGFSAIEAPAVPANAPAPWFYGGTSNVARWFDPQSEVAAWFDPLLLQAAAAPIAPRSFGMIIG